MSLSLVVLLASTACKRNEPKAAVELSSATLSSATIAGIGGRPPIASEPEASRPIEVEELDVDGDLPILVIRGITARHTPMVFLAGMCAHPMGYVTSFPQAAAERGDLIAVQGDIACGDGPNRSWSWDVAKIDRRIDAAFRAAALEPKNLILIGYSQGAERAERLVARYPEKYGRAILMGSPKVPSADNLEDAQAVALVAGTNDMAHDKMRRALPALERANIRSAFFAIPDAKHGEMADEALMSEVLDFVEGKTR